MSAVTTRWWVDGETAWVAVSGVGQEPPMDHFFMDYERHGDEWRRTYPADTPHLERAMDNFAKYLEPILRQFTKLDPVPWRDALRELCRRTAGQPVDWWLTGSAALAVRGAPIEPGDIDLVCGVSDAIALGELFSDALVEPVAPAATEWISEWWGRAFCGARVEWIGGPRPWVDEPSPADFGPVAAARLETVAFEDWQLRVPPLDLQRAVNQRRGLQERVAMIDALTG
ncbi:MAG TPA: hypothetical protein VEV63_08530 [Streptosporangiaceae bacterium]|nr:hypothetical protein [Streptosporangiaceae bacterium]